jgi:hypothetical protein
MWMNYLETSSSTFLSNKYAITYFLIIDRAKSENRKKNNGIYFEAHHILPKSLFPDYKNLRHHPWNGVLLTAREHFICHRLLVKMTTGKAKQAMWSALRRTTTGLSTHRQSREYEKIREVYVREYCGKNHHMYGKKASEETRRKQSIAHKGRAFSEEHKEKIGEANARRVWTEESRRKHSESSKKKIFTQEHRDNIGRKSTGENNPMAGTKWVSHFDLLLSKPVPANKVDVYLQNGWTLGQKKFPDRTGKERGISIIN